MIRLYNKDCRIDMKKMRNNEYQLAICDPEYGINGGLDNRQAIETKSGNNLRRLARKGGTAWDKKPASRKYFIELMRVTENQIIWGDNYFIDKLSPTRCFICWDKMTYIPSMSQMELAWTSFKSHTKYIKINSNQAGRIHQAQKPVQLYKWLLKNYGFNKDGTKRTILDTHFGSLSIGIACADLGFSLTAYEIDQDYFNAAVKRLYNHVNQLNAFVERPEIEVNGEPINEYVKEFRDNEIIS